MRILVANDAYIYRTPDGKHWTNRIYGYSFWKRYLEVFDEVRIIARTMDVESVPDSYLLVDGVGINVYGIDFFRGPKQLTKSYFSIKKKLRLAYTGIDAAIYRVPSQTAQIAYSCKPKYIPFAGEVVYDPYDDLNNKKIGLLMWIVNRIISFQLSSFCRKANGVSYVTKHTIQKHYPCFVSLYGADDSHFESYYSSVSLNDEYYGTKRNYIGNEEFILCLSDVSMNTYRKGEKTLISAVKYLVEDGYNVKAVIIGDGDKREEFEEYAAELGVMDRCIFTGLLSSPDEVRNHLNECDIYVFPSAAEGLPRGILEAMALGMPVVASPVGGIPEVVQRELLVDASDVLGYVNAIKRMVDDRGFMNQISSENLEMAKSFNTTILQKRRNDFLAKLKNLIK